MQNPMMGQIIAFGGNFAPRGWALCEGQLLPVSQYSALFSILGTIYGGDGRTTFALPDLRGRIPIQEGRGPGLSDYPLGRKGGQETVTLTVNQIPSHNHYLNADANTGTTNVPTNHILANTAAFDNEYSTSNPNTQLNSGAIRHTGGGQPHENRMPFLATNYIIALVGVYPSRS